MTLTHIYMIKQKSTGILYMRCSSHGKMQERENACLNNGTARSMLL